MATGQVWAEFYIPGLDPRTRTRCLNPARLLNGFFSQGPNPPRWAPWAPRAPPSQGPKNSSPRHGSIKKKLLFSEKKESQQHKQQIQVNLKSNPPNSFKFPIHRNQIHLKSNYFFWVKNDNIIKLNNYIQISTKSVEINSITVIL